MQKASPDQIEAHTFSPSTFIPLSGMHAKLVEQPISHELMMDSVSFTFDLIKKLDEIHLAAIGTQLSSEIVAQLFEILCQAKLNCPTPLWKSTKQSILAHPLCDVLHQDPCTFRSFSKPRGYAGDAELIDYLYRLNEDYATLTKVQRHLLDHVADRPSAIAVRERVRIAASLIERLVEMKPTAKIVSLACGHFRELSYLSTPEALKDAEIIGIDQDATSLSLARTTYQAMPVSLINAGVTDLIRGRYFIETANTDFFYALGLFDYLSANMAQSVVQLMFSRLTPGGRLMVTNFTPSNPDIGYMETFMDWELIVREIPEMYSLCQLLPQAQIAEIKLYRGCNQCIWYLEVKKNDK
jgi:hypothetical protein